MVQKVNQSYVLALPHITQYYIMKLITFEVDANPHLVIIYPVFITG